MANNVSKSDLVDKVADKLDMTKGDVKKVMDGFLDEVTTRLQAGDKVTLTGFGTFEVRERKAREGVKPGTTEKIQIPASSYPAFKAGKGLKDSVKS